MPNNRISPDIIAAAYAPRAARAVPRASLIARMTARLRADSFDLPLAVGAPAPDGSALAVHAARLTTVREREAVARSLRQALAGARRGQSANMLAAQHLVDAITLRLLSPRPVHVRGMARLRRVLSDDTAGDLAGRLGAALAEL